MWHAVAATTGGTAPPVVGVSCRFSGLAEMKLGCMDDQARTLQPSRQVSAFGVWSEVSTAIWSCSGRLYASSSALKCRQPWCQVSVSSGVKQAGNCTSMSVSRVSSSGQVLMLLHACACCGHHPPLLPGWWPVCLPVGCVVLCMCDEAKLMVGWRMACW